MARESEAKTFEEWRGKSFYERWQEKEDIPIYRGYTIEDIHTLPLAPWGRTGGSGAFLNLSEQQESDGQVTEIPPKGTLLPQRHLYEAIVYILSGRGATTLWLEGQFRQSFEWEAGALFAIPLNVNYQHFNGSAQEPVRLIAFTDAPTNLNRFHNEDFIFRNPFAFPDRYQGEEDFFTWEGKRWKPRVWETNLVPNVRTFPLDLWNEKGKGTRHMRFAMGDGTLGCHIHEVQPGTYTMAHRHGPGALVMILEGTGYEYLWMEGGLKQRIELKPGTIICPGRMMYHHHFCTSRIPMRQLALRSLSPKWNQGEEFIEGHQMDLIHYSQEDPAVRAEFLAELAKEGVECLLDPV